MKPSLPFTPEILNSDMYTIYIKPLYAKPFDIVTYFDIKTVFGELITQLESVFLGTFGKGFNIGNEDEEIFSRLYPYMYRKLKQSYNNWALIALSKGLDTFRNYNMHARCNTYLESFNNLVKLVKTLPNYSKEIHYHKNNSLTFAGMLVIILLLSNERMINYLFKNHAWDNFVERLRLFGPEKISFSEFPEKLLKLSEANFAINIREDKKCDDINEAIFGRFLNKTEIINETFKYFSGKDQDNAEYWCSGGIRKINDDEIIIEVNKGSYMPEFYHQNYTLNVKDVELFKKYCMNLPPFCFISYLFHSGVTTFDKNTIPEDKKLVIDKLNHPKFYVDKNINTLLLPGTISDLRLSSQIVAAGLNYCFTKLENELYAKFHLDYTGYTQLRNALVPFNFDSSLVNKVISMRNFFAHQHILGDNVKYGFKKFYNIDLKFVFDTMYDLITVLEMKDPMHAEYLRKNFFYKVILNLVYMKYFDSYKNTSRLLTTNDLPTLIDTMRKAELRRKNSYLTQQIEDMIPLFVKNNDVAFIYYNKDRKSFSKIYQTMISSDRNIILKNGKDIGLKEFTIFNFSEPKLDEIFEYSECKKIPMEDTELLIRRKFILN